MMNEKRVGVFLPGRLASERLPNKLILPLGESCLWDMACKKLNNLPDDIDKYVLCHEKELINIAAKYDNLKIIVRGEDTIYIDGPLIKIFKDLKDVESTHLLFLNGCLSFLKADTIVKSINDFKKSKYDYGTSVKLYKNWLWDKVNRTLTDIDYKTLSTKEIPDYYEAAHCFHIFNKDNFFKDGQMLVENEIMKLVVPKEETIDVDDYADYQYAKFLHAKRYVFDLDNTICTTVGTDYENAKPIQNRIDKINKLAEADNYIIINTARGSGSGKDLYKLTKDQLDSWGLNYNELIVSKKPYADYYIDDKAINDKDFIW